MNNVNTATDTRTPWWATRWRCRGRAGFAWSPWTCSLAGRGGRRRWCRRSTVTCEREECFFNTAWLPFLWFAAALDGWFVRPTKSSILSACDCGSRLLQASVTYIFVYTYRHPFWRQKTFPNLSSVSPQRTAGYFAHPPLALPSPLPLTRKGTASTTPGGTATGMNGWSGDASGGRSTLPTCRRSSRSGTWLRCGARART